jgi:hypothetical protein
VPAEEAGIPDRPPDPRLEEEHELRPVRAPTSVRAALAIVLVTFAAIVVAITAGGPERRRPDSVPTPPSGATDGILVYSVSDDSGAARLWLWHLQTGEVTEGPLIREPLELVSVRSPGFGWIAFTSDLGNGIEKAAVFDSLAPDAEAEPIGSGDIVEWGRNGGTAILVERGPLQSGCRRRAAIVAVNIDKEGGETVLDDTICGDVLSVGRTSLGYFVTTERRGVADVVEADVVGAGYDDAGVLLDDHGVIAIAPSGEMLVTPSSEFLPGSGDDAPIAGAAWYFRQFGGRPVPYLVEGSPLRVDQVLAFAQDSVQALAIGRLPGEDPGLWELPLRTGADGPRTPRFVGTVTGPTAAAYAADGTAFVVTPGRLWEVRGHRMEPLDLPEGSPAPTGPLVWIVREPLTEL